MRVLCVGRPPLTQNAGQAPKKPDNQRAADGAVPPEDPAMSHNPNLPALPPDRLEPVLAALRASGWGVFPDFFAPELMADLRHELWGRAEQDQLRPAGVGKEGQRLSAVRGDYIRWLNGATPPQRRFLAAMEALRLRVNRELLLGLEDLECHFAHYPPGAGYARHLDSFDSNNLRRLTVVAYLNPQWTPADGGQMRIFDGEAVIAEVQPRSGALVCFISEEIAHEVVATQRHRASIAGWFRVRPLTAQADALGGQVLAG